METIFENEYAKEIAMPEAAKAGLKRVVGVANAAKKFGMPFKMFNNPDDAKKWFTEFDKS